MMSGTLPDLARRRLVRTRRASFPAQRGFTLIEVMIAIALMALVSLLSWKGLEQVSHARDWLGAQSADQAIILRTLGQIERDLNRAYAATADGSGAVTPDAGRNSRANNPPSRSTPLLPSGIDITASGVSALVNLVRATPDTGMWQRVTWRLRPDGLWRYSGEPAARYPLPEPDDGLLIMPGVTRLDIRAWLTGQGWVDPSRPAGSRAAGLEIAIERQHRAQHERYTRVVVLP